MPARDPNPTIRQILRAVLKVAVDAVSVPFARRKAIRFMSSGQSIRGCFYYARSNSKTVGILLLPTAFGLTAHEHAFAARLAREGYTTLVIGYSRRTTGAVVKNELRRKHLEQIVMDGWRVLQRDPKVDATDTAVIGLSLGGYFATYIATATKEFAPKAVVVYYGMYSLGGSELANLRVPLLILQGENDDSDFLANARRALEISIRDEKPWEVVLYPDTGHQFDLFEPNGAAARDAWERTLSFLSKHLRSST